MTQTRQIDAAITEAINRWTSAIGTPGHQAASEALDDVLERLCVERARGTVELGGIALMIGGHYRDDVWYLEHPKAPAPIPCQNIAFMVEKYLKIIEQPPAARELRDFMWREHGVTMSDDDAESAIRFLASWHKDPAGLHTSGERTV